MAVTKDVTLRLFEFGRQPLSEEATNACLIVNPCRTNIHLQLLTVDAAGLEAHRYSDI
jgi:hypothetical protein